MKTFNLDVLLVLCLSLISTWAQNIQVRLVGGNGTNQGRVEVQYNGTWGTVCDDNWPDLNAEVVCRSLGLPFTGAVGLCFAYFGEGNGDILMDDVECVGNESSLDQCEFLGWNKHNCIHSEDASVICRDDCSRVPIIPHGYVEAIDPSNTTYAALAYVLCNLGYNASITEITCTRTAENDTWQIPVCTAKDCGVVPTIPYGNIQPVDQSNLTYGAIAIVTCNEGYNATMSEITCTANGTWQIPICSSKDCGQVPAISDGYVEAVDPANTTRGALANVTCYLGYNSTLAEITCTENDTWQIPTCSAIDCGQVPAIPDGYVEAVDPANTTYGALANVTCYLGYNSTLAEITCTENGTWQIPICLAIDLNDIPKYTNLNNSVVVEEITVIGTTVFTVSYSDTDEADMHTIFMTNSEGGTLYFDISAAGEIFTKAAVNYEALFVKIFSFTIVVSDGKASATGTLTVTVADVNEPLTWNSATYRTDELEQTAVGTTLIDPGFAITDPDAGDTYACTMDCGGSNGYFAMDTACKVRVSSSYSLDAGLPNTVTCTEPIQQPQLSSSTSIVSAGQISTQVNMPEICNCSDITFAVPVLATDTGGLVGTATVYITVLPYTPTTAKTTTDRYRTFFEDTKNIAWVSLIMTALAITSFVTVFFCARYVCNPSAKRRRLTSRPKDIGKVRDPPKRIEPESNVPKPRSVIFVRPPPQPRGIQSLGIKPLFKRY